MKVLDVLIDYTINNKTDAKIEDTKKKEEPEDIDLDL